MNPQPLPPWGPLDERCLKEIAKKPVPDGWRSPDGSNWPTWLQGVIDVISTHLWPVYVNSSTWATAQIQQLHDADFALMLPLHERLRTPITAVHPTAVTHLELFLDEDGPEPFGARYERYDPSLTSSQRTKLKNAMSEALKLKARSVHLQMKQQFQRPRPWQVHMIEGRQPPFAYWHAGTAFTPSLVSGHCFQGCIAGCAALSLFTPQMSASIQVLQQFAMDIGDRRVFAGVHYPSDNLSSWYTALRLVPTIFDVEIVPSVRAFLWEAIATKSIVFRAIMEHVAAGSSPYAAMVSEIERAAQTDISNPKS